MKTLVISGSRNPEGRTARAINNMSEGVSRAGGSTECFFLPELTLERCRQCESDGWGTCRDEDECVIDDDFVMIEEKINEADVVVFANPVYFGDLSESMKAFLDRLRRVRSKIPRTPITGHPGPFNKDDGKIAIGLCYAGGSGNGTTNCCMNLERTLQICGFDVVDMVPARRQNLEAKQPALELVGKWLATKPSSAKCKLEPI